METDVRVGILKSILNTPHNKLSELVPLHKENLKIDPLFYSKLSIYYDKHGEVRDHKKLFAAGIITSPLYEFRDLGGLLMLKLNAKDYLKTVKLSMDDFQGKSGGKRRRLRYYTQKYLRFFEKQANNGNSGRFLQNAKFLRNLYRIMHVAPEEAAAKSLKFKAPDDAKPYEAFKILSLITKTKDEEQICEYITKYRLPALSLIGAVKNITPAIAASMLEGMTPKQTQIFIKMFQRRGVLKDFDFKKAVNAKIKKGAKKGNLSMRGVKAAKVTGADTDIMTTATDNFVKSLPPINKKILLCIDKSSSMQVAISLGKDIASILAAKIVDPKNNLRIYAFNNVASKIPLPTKALYSEFDINFRYMRANGTTSLGAPLKKAVMQEDFKPGTIVFITDGVENEPPYLNKVIENYFANVRIISCLVGTRICPIEIDENLKKSKSIEVENIDFSKGDYYSLPNLVKVIASGGIRDLMEEIDNIDLMAEIDKLKTDFKNRRQA